MKYSVNGYEVLPKVTVFG